MPPWHPRHAPLAAVAAKRGTKGTVRAQPREVAARVQPRVPAQQGKPPALGATGWEYGAPSQQEPRPLPLPLSHRHQVGSILGGPNWLELTVCVFVVVTAASASFQGKGTEVPVSNIKRHTDTLGAPLEHADHQTTSLCRGRGSGGRRLECPGRAATPAQSRGCPCGSSCTRPSTWPACQGAAPLQML